VDEPRILAAIAAMRTAIDQQRGDDRVAEQRRVEAIRAVADRVRSSYEQELGELRARINASLLSVDPLRETWNVFRAFGVERDETSWTQWLATILRQENGERCARVAWGAFCDAVARRATLVPPSGDSNLADHAHWAAIAGEVPMVKDEVSAGDLGRLDMLVETPSIVAAVENKLWADWHDGPKRPQADRYRDIAKSRLGGDTHRRLGLVLLSERHGLKPGDYPNDYIHVRWTDLGQSLRRALRREWSAEQRTILDLWPIVLTLVSIERDLLGHALTHDPATNRNAVLKALSELATYLEER
jgi:hypothetical protein